MTTTTPPKTITRTITVTPIRNSIDDFLDNCVVDHLKLFAKDYRNEGDSKRMDDEAICYIEAKGGDMLVQYKRLYYLMTGR